MSDEPANGARADPPQDVSTPTERSGRGRILGLSIYLEERALEVYSVRPVKNPKRKSQRGEKVKVGVRCPYGGGSATKRIELVDLPDGVDEVDALKRLAAHYRQPRVLDIVMALKVDG